jgi:hypothetical protein
MPDRPVRVMQRPWLTKLEPTGTQNISGSSLLLDRAEDLASLPGPGPVAWALQPGSTMTHRITSAIPELATDAVAVEMRRGCEAVAWVHRPHSSVTRTSPSPRCRRC